jgi:hypothetical protein
VLAADGLPDPTFVHRASTAAGDRFFAARAPDHRVIADPSGRLFAGFGLTRGSLGQLLGPAVCWRGLLALLRGHSIGIPTGNEAQMPGAFLVRGRTILWQHRARHSADHPDFAAAARAML